MGRTARARVLAGFVGLLALLVGVADAAVRTRDFRGPRITITAPVKVSTYQTGASMLSLAGVASSSVVRITWINDRGGNGEASGTRSWSASQVPLAIGTNKLLVTAYDSAGRRRSDALTVVRSEPVAEPTPQPSASDPEPTAPVPPPDTTPPSAPSGLQASAASASQVDLAWTAASDAVGVTGYRVQRCQDAGCTSFRQIGTTASTRYSDAGLLSGTSYSYRVQAADAAGNVSAYSGVSTAVTTAAYVPPATSEPPPADVSDGASYYVAGAQSNASDSNPGTESQPWKTIAYAARVAKAGDTVYIKAGLYSGAVSVANSGEAGREIVFRAWPGDEHRAILDGGGITIKGKSYIQFRGLKIQNAPGSGISVQGPDDWRAAPARFITISGNHIYNTYSSAVAVWGVRWGLDPGDYEGVTDIVVEKNLIEKAVNGGYNECITVANGVLRADVRDNELRNGGDPANGGEGIDFKEGVRDSSIQDNFIHGLTRRAIYIDGGRQETALTSNIRIHGNVVLDDPGDAIFVMSEGAGDVDGVYLYNNLVVGADRNGMGIYQHPNGVGIGAVNDVQFVNNTVLYGGRAGTGWGGIGVNMPAATQIVIRNNVVANGNGFDIRANGDTRIDHNLCRESICESRGDALFFNPTLDPDTWDYRLKAGSPAIDRGSSTGAPATDMDGISRPRGAAVDLGAYEYLP